MTRLSYGSLAFFVPKIQAVFILVLICKLYQVLITKFSEFVFTGIALLIVDFQGFKP